MPTNSQPSVPTLEDARRATETARRRLLIVLRLTYLLLLATAALLPFVGDMTNTADEVVVSDYAGAFILLVGLGSFVVLVDVFTPEKRLANVIAIYFGVVVGLVRSPAFRSDGGLSLDGGKLCPVFVIVTSLKCPRDVREEWRQVSVGRLGLDWGDTQ